jgi:hypothetical protein
MKFHLPFRSAREFIFPYIHNRWVDPSHKITIHHPDFPHGSYREADERILFGMFQVLVDYVEIECSVFPCCTTEQSRLFETPWQTCSRWISTLPGLHYFIPPTRNARRGLHHLRWAMKLGAESPGQAASAKDIFELYRFWIHTRPRRVNPWEAYTESRVSRDWERPLTPKERKLLDRCHGSEERHHQEDARMLMRLIKRRRDLWT